MDIKKEYDNGNILKYFSKYRLITDSSKLVQETIKIEKLESGNYVIYKTLITNIGKINSEQEVIEIVIKKNMLNYLEKYIFRNADTLTNNFEKYVKLRDMLKKTL